LDLISGFGPLTIDQIVGLVECENSTHKFGPNSSVFDKTRVELTKLLFETNLIQYEPSTGLYSRRLSVEKNLPTTFESFTGVKSADLRFEKIGYGSEYVYVVYSKFMRFESILTNKSFWPLKVGKTNNLKKRVKQLSESGPNSLMIGLAIRSDTPLQLERVIHSELKRNGQAIKLAHRQEWFWSNIHQIKNIHNRFVLKERI